ncbi:hypothetical protein BDP27DRAFT_1430155 [Rhodocollybia butyracea]|uniref:Uncharacterized protein n=1 Tax=Rhodocollybia butyracea TaxID=206335 RepID=A0A9P5TZI2_9AGAR|nr:hypothetical protein BDP27DRAFT_1430155 [Rhodocollybia butyracea]
MGSKNLSAKKASGKLKNKKSSIDLTGKTFSALRKETAKNAKGIRSGNTNTAYDGIIKRMRNWLKYFIKGQNQAQTRGEEVDLDVGFEEPVDSELMDPEFGTCLEGTPVKCTPEALAMFMSWKCFDKEKGKSTAEQIHAGWKHHYKLLDGDKYCGPWKYNMLINKWTGNPCNSSTVTDMLEACKRKGGESERHHSKPMSIVLMEKVYSWSIVVCPDDYLVVDAVSLAFKMRHLRYRAFASVGFTIWTRNAETSHLQAKHVDLDPLPRPGATPTDPPFIQLNLRDRKNWQKREGKNETQLSGHQYNCYPQKNRAICVYTHLQIWMTFSEMHILQRKYEPDDFIFPTINANGVTVQSRQPITPDAVQKMISEFTHSAGLIGALTTHCFPREEHNSGSCLLPLRDTLIWYLLDELNTYKEDHSDALAPLDHRASESHAGEAAEMSPLSTSEGRALFNLVDQSIKTQFSVAFPCLALGGAPQSFGFNSQLFIPSSLPVPHQQSPMNIRTSQLLRPKLIILHPLRNSSAQSSLFSTHFGSFNTPGFASKTSPTSYTTGPSKATYSQLATTGPLKSGSILLPGLAHLPVVIPKISPDPDAWKQVVLDWDKTDPTCDHHYALKDWKPEWAKETRLSTHYGQRRMIALEFIDFFGRDEAAFVAAYPMHGIQQLVLAIRRSHQDQGLAKRHRGKHTIA